MTETDVERCVAEQRVKMSVTGRRLPEDMLRAFARSHLEAEARFGSSQLLPSQRSVALTSEPLGRPQAAAKPPVPPYLAAERAQRRSARCWARAILDAWRQIS